MTHTKCQKTFLLADRADDASIEADLVRSTWNALSKGKKFHKDELKEVFAFDFSDIMPHMKWDTTTTRQ